MNGLEDTVRPLIWDAEGLRVLDQRRLPAELIYETCRTAEEVAEAIASMRVRGAPAIGIAAAYGVVLAARQRLAETPAGWREAIAADLERLARSRPTAVNLFWALDRMRSVLREDSSDPVGRLLAEAISIHEADIAANRRMGELGAEYLRDAQGLLTHCNTGSLATGGYGTALGVIRSACRQQAKAVKRGQTRYLC